MLIIVAAEEIKRVPKFITQITTKHVVITTDPNTGQQFQQVVEQNMASNVIDQVIDEMPEYLPKRNHKIGAFIASAINLVT